MSDLRINNLRNALAKVGEKQLEYYNFFPSFADRLVSELGTYLGSTDSVKLCCAYGDFEFENSGYCHGGLGFENGLFRIPIMVQLKNLKDEGHSLLRLRIYFSKTNEVLTAKINGLAEIEFTESNSEQLHEYIYQCLSKECSEATWFGTNKSDYQGSKIGFSV